MLRGAAEIIAHLGNRRACHFNPAEVAGAYSQALGQAQGAVGCLERRGAPVGHGIKSHERHAHCVSGDAICACNQQTWLDVDGAGIQGPSPAGHGFDAIDDGEVNGSCGNEIRDHTRHAETGVVADMGVDQGRSALRCQPFARMDDAASTFGNQSGFIPPGRLHRILYRELYQNSSSLKA